MKTAIFLLAATFVYLALPSCKDDLPPAPDCDNLITGLVQFDRDAVGAEINHLASDLEPQPVQGDNLGHQQNLQTLVDRLNENCDGLSATMGCYACFLSLPTQSTILIDVDSSGQQVRRVVSIFTSPDTYLETHTVN